MAKLTVQWTLQNHSRPENKSVVSRRDETLYHQRLRKKQQIAVKYVAEKKDSTYYDLVTKHLVEMETYVFVSFLMLRDALKVSERENFAERYILDAVPEFDRSYAVVMSGDMTLIDNHRELIDY